jgi:glycosyltransferase involved in cell wall biosynthesis
LAAGLREALDGGPAVKVMTESAYERAAELSLDSLARRYLELYTPLLAKH